jgi:hypothetical protein
VFPSKQGSWPDSPTVFCTDGSLAGTCPSAQQTAFGQDGNYDGPGNTYIETNGVVSDALLGIEWTRAFSGPSTWTAANTYCDGLDFDGKQDWRLPTRQELISIVDYGRYDPVLDVAVFDAPPTASNKLFWTSRPHASSGQDHWIVNSQEGNVVGRSNILTAQVRCARGTTVTGTAMQLAGCDIIHDSFAGLGWQRWTSGQTYSWLGAIQYCEGLDQDGFSDWRLPSVKELETIVDASALNPAIDGNLFPGTPAEMFWTSTPFANFPANS